MNIIRIMQRWVSELSWSTGRAAHVAKGNQHRVILNDVRVIIVPDGDRWFAQGIDINYATDGSSIHEVQQNFESGLSLTIKANLQRVGNIDRIMRSPDMSVWAPLLQKKGLHFDFSMSDVHEMDDAELPYRRIQYSFAKAA